MPQFPAGGAATANASPTGVTGRGAPNPFFRKRSISNDRKVIFIRTRLGGRVRLYNSNPVRVPQRARTIRIVCETSLTRAGWTDECESATGA